MRKLKTIAVAFLFLFSLLFVVFNVSQVHAAGTSYYVSTTGSDSDAGGLAHPFKTIQKGVDVSVSGDTVYVMAGEYFPSTGHIQITNMEDSNEWFTLRNYNNDVVIIDGTDCPTAISNGINAVIEIDISDYIRISGLTINHSASGGISAGIWAGSRAINHIRIDNCSITNSSAQAFKSKNGNDNITFEYNYIYNNFNNWTGSVKSTQETISFENVDTFSINNNTIINNRAANIDVKGGCKWGEICYNEINNTGGYLLKLGQTFYGGPAIMLDSRGISHNISIYNNKIYGNQTGISINTETTGHYEYIYLYNNIINITNETGGKHTFTGRQALGLYNTGLSTDMFHHIYIYSNTIRTGVNNIFAIFQIGHFVTKQLSSSNLQDVYIVNNIFTTAAISSTDILAINHISIEDGVIILNNNSYYRATGTLRVYWNGTYYTTTSPTKWGDEPLFTNQQFVDEPNGDFHLNSTSPCIDNGNSALVPSFDYDGLSRPQGTGYDIGAYEYPAHITILIASDSDFNVINGVRYGSGTVANPYVICNYNIYNISVSGTTKNLTIYNCTILHHVLISGLSASSNLLFDTVTMDGAGHIPLSYIYLTHTLTTFTNSKFYNLSYSYMKNG